MGLGLNLKEIEESLGCAACSIIGPITPGIDIGVNQMLEAFPIEAREGGHLAVILDTPGGYVEIVERMVRSLRHFFPRRITFIILDSAMSAGTVFAMSGEEIIMDYFSQLGPIDPQIEKDGRLIPALAYVEKFEELNAKAAEGNLTSAEYALIEKLDLAELYQFEQAQHLSVDLLEEWLSTYKFSDWKVTESSRETVTEEMKKKRAKHIAMVLSDTKRWRTHGRGISRDVLRSEEIKLKITDLEENPELQSQLKSYFSLVQDYMWSRGLARFLHSRYFI